MENEHGPGTGWQLCNRAIEAQAVDHAGETEIPRSRLPVMTLRLIVAFIHFLDGSDDVGLPTEAHEDDIYGEPVQPSGERGIAAKTSDLSKQLKKGILRQIFGQRQIAANHAHTERINTPAMQAIETFESGGIASLGQTNGFRLR